MQKLNCPFNFNAYAICSANVLFNTENGNSKNCQSVGTKLQVQTPLTYDIN